MDAKPPDLSAGSPAAGLGRRDRAKAQNREIILAGARQVFAELGYAAATVRDIIRATPLASGTFYNYFKSKEEVYLALRDQQALAIRPRLRQARLAAANAEAFVADSFRVFFRFVVENERASRRAGMDSPEALAGFTELRQDVVWAMAQGVLPAGNADLLSAALAGLALELAEQVKAGAGVEQTVAFATALVLGGLGALPKS
ncbi:MAG TPA: TetR/AcrR family transcriptional regulator [Rhizomicrobium sp.]|nr:TetR/AcrR family transcriptional regulator [Rhizomicrobium sp.]